MAPKLCVFGFIVFLYACTVYQVPLKTQIVPSENVTSLYVLEEDVTIKASKASPTTLKAGTTWTEVGFLDQGTVFRTRDQVVIVNSFNVHEGFIVVSGNSVVGYYLPVEKSFVETKPENIKLTKKGNSK